MKQRNMPSDVQWRTHPPITLYEAEKRQNKETIIWHLHRKIRRVLIRLANVDEYAVRYNYGFQKLHSEKDMKNIINEAVSGRIIIYLNGKKADPHKIEPLRFIDKNERCMGVYNF